MEEIKVRTTMRPHEELDVGMSELKDLARMGLLTEVEGHAIREDAPSAKDNRTATASGNK